MDRPFPLHRLLALGSACGLLLAAGVALDAAPARAASISSITYTVTGGTVTYTVPGAAVGTITGGTLTVTPSTLASTATVACGPGQTGPFCATLAGTFMTTGVFGLTFPFPPIFTKLHIKTGSGLTGAWPFLILPTGGGGTATLASGSVDLAPGSYLDFSETIHSTMSFSIAFAAHVQLGNEVRVPEPATGALLGLGLGTLALAGTGGGLLARGRRAHRR